MSWGCLVGNEVGRGGRAQGSQKPTELQTETQSLVLHVLGSQDAFIWCFEDRFCCFWKTGKPLG